jgi:DNA-binding PadR family transcriptional regulator
MPTPDTKLLQGTLDMLILKALSLGPLHGYGIGQRIMQMSEDALRVEEGSLYPALYRTERRQGLDSHSQRYL